MKNTVVNGLCTQCGRDYRSEDDMEILFGDCPEVDECPAYFEAEGVAHPPRRVFTLSKDVAEFASKLSNNIDMKNIDMKTKTFYIGLLVVGYLIPALDADGYYIHIIHTGSTDFTRIKSEPLTEEEALELMKYYLHEAAQTHLRLE